MLDMVVLTLMVIALVISLGVVKKQHEKEIKRREEFLKVFVSQEVVDRVLKSEAQFLHQEFLREQEWQSDSKTKATNAEYYEGMLEGSKRRVLRSKKEFLRKADLAKREGYQVPGSYIELLPKPDDPPTVSTGTQEGPETGITNFQGRSVDY